jgi:high-affinity iron transporter
VGEQAQEMQLAQWIPTTRIDWLANLIPPWMNLWLAVFPTRETIIAQIIAAVLVVGSYYAARHFGGGAPAEKPTPDAAVVRELETVP